LTIDPRIAGEGNKWLWVWEGGDIPSRVATIRDICHGKASVALLYSPGSDPSKGSKTRAKPRRGETGAAANGGKNGAAADPCCGPAWHRFRNQQGFFFGTGNGDLGLENSRGAKGLDNLYTCSIRRRGGCEKTGKLKCTSNRSERQRGSWNAVGQHHAGRISKSRAATQVAHEAHEEWRSSRLDSRGQEKLSPPKRAAGENGPRALMRRAGRPFVKI